MDAPTFDVRTRTVDTARRRVVSDVTHRIDVDATVVVGREGDLPVGLDPPDAGLSRRALVVTARRGAWDVSAPNRYGALMQPWGQAATWWDHDAARIRVRRVGVRLIGSVPDLHHWVLLVASRLEPVEPDDHHLGRDEATVVGDPPPPLTTKQREAVATVFAPHLAWPPVAGPVALTLQAAARRLGVTDSAVAQRLEAAQRVAYALGAHRQLSVVGPEFVHVLARHGYLDEPGD